MRTLHGGHLVALSYILFGWGYVDRSLILALVRLSERVHWRGQTA
jgi:hypothetical protein